MEANEFEKQNNEQAKKKKSMLMIIGLAAVAIILVGATYAFFNYTRTGGRNTVRVGKIYFNSEEGQAIHLTNLFPIDVSEGIPNDATKVGILTINIKGDTTYDKGIDYVVKAVNVQNTVGSGLSEKALPISINVSVTNNTGNNPATTLGTSTDNLDSVKGGETSYYQVVATDVISNNSDLVVGYIAPGQTGIDGNIVIKAYIDKAKVAITDTYPEGTTYTVKTTLGAADITACQSALAGVNNVSNICDTSAHLQTAIDAGNVLSVAQITALENAGIVTEYTDGTTSTWVGTRTRFTTDEWNSLQSSGVSFQVQVIAEEGAGSSSASPALPANALYSVITENAEPDNANSTYVQNISTEDLVDAKVSFLDNVEKEGKVIRLSAGIDFSNPSSTTNGKGVYIKSDTQNSAHPIYYFRGNVDNNNVVFGGFCWLIVRTTETGGIKIVYNGAVNNDGTCTPSTEPSEEVPSNRRTGDETVIGAGVFNASEKTFENVYYEIDDSLAPSGYMHGFSWSTFEFDSIENGTYANDYIYDGGDYWLVDAGSESTAELNNTSTTPDSTHRYAKIYGTELMYVYKLLDNVMYYIVLYHDADVAGAINQMNANTADSDAKAAIDTWYASHMTSYTSKLEDTIWCNDRSITNSPGLSVTGSITSDSSSTIEFPGNDKLDNNIISLTCSQANDRFTVSSSNGNGALTYPVGLLTIDELMLGGLTTSYLKRSTDSYLFNGLKSWSLSPVAFYPGNGITMAYADDEGFLTAYNAMEEESNINYRPAVSLKYDTTIVDNGADGTPEHPYVIN